MHYRNGREAKNGENDKIVHVAVLSASILFCASLSVSAQTNAPPATPAPAAAQSASLDKTATDIESVCQDFGMNVSVKGILSTLTMIFLGARILRKAVPDQAQTGWLGLILSHAALEVNPTPGMSPPPKTTPV